MFPSFNKQIIIKHVRIDILEETEKKVVKILIITLEEYLFQKIKRNYNTDCFLTLK